MQNYPFPDPPEPPVLPWYRRIPQAYLWWAGSVVFLGLTVIWLPSQCVLDDLGIPARGNAEEAGFPKLDQDNELEFRKDELWYKLNDEKPFTGFAETYHANGKIRSRTKVKDGVAYGLIEEWDENGTIKGTPFKGEYSPK